VGFNGSVAFSTLTLLVWQLKGILPVKSLLNLSLGVIFWGLLFFFFFFFWYSANYSRSMNPMTVTMLASADCSVV